MVEQIQELIDKIKTEGVQSAQDHARQIEDDAQAKAGAIITRAEETAQVLKTEAQEEVKRTQEAVQRALEQAARDMLLSLRRQIEAALQKIIAQEVSAALPPEQLAAILSDVIKNTVKGEGKAEVVLSEKDFKKLKDTVLAKLTKEIKGEIVFKSADDIGGGFTISYDAGKSSYDFTDENLAQYLGSFLNTQVATILKDSVQ